MLSEIIRIMMVKSIAKHVVTVSMKNSNQNENVVKEKLGVSSIDEFMRKDIHELERKRY